MWLVIGLSGATCSGKTTVARMLHQSLPNSCVICQDDYFYPKDSQHHTYVPELDCYNWEIMSSLDMVSMFSMVNNLVSDTSTVPTCRVLILEGFLLLNYKPLRDICHLKYYLTLTREECEARRSLRVYDPPDCPGYFDRVVWPEYERHRDELFELPNVKIVDGSLSNETVYQHILPEILEKLKDFK